MLLKSETYIYESEQPQTHHSYCPECAETNPYAVIQIRRFCADAIKDVPKVSQYCKNHADRLASVLLVV